MLGINGTENRVKVTLWSNSPARGLFHPGGRRGKALAVGVRARQFTGTVGGWRESQTSDAQANLIIHHAYIEPDPGVPKRPGCFWIDETGMADSAGYPWGGQWVRLDKPAVAARFCAAQCTLGRRVTTGTR